MDCILYLKNTMFVPSCLGHLVAIINFYEENRPDDLFGWKNMFLLCIVYLTVHYSRRAEHVIEIIWS